MILTHTASSVPLQPSMRSHQPRGGRCGAGRAARGGGSGRSPLGPALPPALLFPHSLPVGALPAQLALLCRGCLLWHMVPAALLRPPACPVVGACTSAARLGPLGQQRQRAPARRLAAGCPCLAPSLPLPSPAACRAYLDAAGGPRPLLAASFSEWVQERRELKFLLSQLDLS